jgi:parallel beta-helix repeat protein
MVTAQTTTSSIWIISGETYFSNEVFLLNESIAIQAGGALFLSNATISWNNHYNGEYSFRIETGGRLVMENGSLFTSLNSYGYNITAEPGSALKISNSTIEHGGFETISYISPALLIATDNAKIQNISFLHTGKKGIDIIGSSGSIVRDCDFLFKSPIGEKRGHGIFVKDSHNVLIHNNSINTFGKGIYLSSVENITIKRNTINTTGHAIHVNHSKYVYIQKNAVAAPKFEYMGYFTDMNYGIYAWVCPFVFVEENIFVDNRAGAIYLFNSPCGYIRGNVIRNCYWDAMVFGGSDGGIFFDNEVTGVGRDAIYASSNNILITRNSFSDFKGLPKNWLGAVLLNAHGCETLLFYLNNVSVPFQYLRIFIQEYNSDVCFDNGTHGNFWQGYLGNDSNGDGVSDTPFTYANDNHPLMEPVQVGMTMAAEGPYIARISSPFDSLIPRISAMVYDYVPIVDVTLSYSTDLGESWINTTMNEEAKLVPLEKHRLFFEEVEGNCFSCFSSTLPRQPHNITVFLKVFATNSKGNSTVSSYSVIVIGGLIPSTSYSGDLERPNSRSTSSISDLSLAFCILIFSILGIHRLRCK